MKFVQAEAGSGVAAVFDLGNDLIRLNLFLAVLLLSAVVIPSAVYYDYKDVPSWNSSYPNSSCDSETQDQMWGWITLKNSTQCSPGDFQNDSSFLCSGVGLTDQDLTVCTLYYC